MKFSSFCILIASAFSICSGFGIFENKGYFSDKPLCQQINSTFYQKINDILEKLGKMFVFILMC